MNNTLASDITKRIPASVAHQLTPAGLKAATNPQSLVDPTYRATVVQTAQHVAAQSAVAHVPLGPQHDQVKAMVAAQAIQQAQHLLNQVFETLRLSLAYAIQHGLIAVLVFCGAIILATFFLKDIPMTQQAGEAPDEAEAVEEREEDVSMVLDEAPVVTWKSRVDSMVHQPFSATSDFQSYQNSCIVNAIPYPDALHALSEEYR